MKAGQLNQREVDKAYRLFYGEGMTLRMVMQELNCNLYDLTPWLTAPAIRIAREAIKDQAAPLPDTDTGGRNGR